MQSRDLFKCKVMSGSSRCSIHSCVLLLLGQLKEGKQARMPTSAVQLAKRALVVLLHALAQVYDVRVTCARTSEAREFGEEGWPVGAVLLTVDMLWGGKDGPNFGVGMCSEIWLRWEGPPLCWHRSYFWSSF